MLNLRPIGDNVLVKRKAAPSEHRGIIIPDAAKQKPTEAEVLAVGPGRYEGAALVPPEVKPGDTVLFGKYTGTEIKLDGEDLLVLRASDLMGVLSP